MCDSCMLCGGAVKNRPYLERRAAFGANARNHVCRSEGIPVFGQYER